MSVGTVITALIIIVPVTLAVYNIKFNQSSTKKRIVITTAVFAVLFAAAFISAVVDNIVSESYSEDHKAISGGLFNSVYYEGDDGGYHTFYASGFLSGGTYYAVPDSVDMPMFSGLWREVTLYIPNGSTVSPDERRIRISGSEFERLPDDTVIKGSYFELDLAIMLFSFAGFALYEVIRAIVTAVKRKKG